MLNIAEDRNVEGKRGVFCPNACESKNIRSLQNKHNLSFKSYPENGSSRTWEWKNEFQILYVVLVECMAKM